MKFNIKGENGLTTEAKDDNVTVKLDTATKDKIDNAADKDLSNLNPTGEQKVKDLAAWKVVANNGTAEDVKGGDTVKYIMVIIFSLLNLVKISHSLLSQM